jgi:hypothetical protein
VAEATYARIQAAAKIVNARADAVTAQISKIEERLQAAGAGIDVEDDVAFYTEQRSQSSPVPKSEFGVTPFNSIGIIETAEQTFMVEDLYSLAYARVGDKFRVAYVIDTFKIGGSGSQIDRDGPHPLADADRQTRLMAESRLTDLVEHIADELEKLSGSAPNTIKK